MRYATDVYGNKLYFFIYEQYEYRGWLITIEQRHPPKPELIGFSTPTEYADKINYDWSWEIEDDIPFIRIEDPFDDNTIKPCTSPSIMLQWLVDEIDYELDGGSICVFCNRTKKKARIVVLKEKNRQPIKSSPKQRGYLHTAWASLVKNRDGKCQECGSIYDLHAHHINSYKDHPELKYDVSNGVTLCGDCHRKAHKAAGKYAKQVPAVVTDISFIKSVAEPNE